MAGPRRFYIDMPHGQVHGRIADQSEGPWIVLLHQSPSSSAMFEALMARLAPRYCVIAPDNPGFGQSDPWPQLSMEAFGDVVAAVMDAFGIESAFVFGHHTGASVGVNLALLHPSKVLGLALCGPPVLSQERRIALPNMAPIEGPDDDGSHFARMWARLRAKETTAPAALSTREVGLAFSAAAHTLAAYQSVANQDFSTMIGQVSQPLFIFAGERDSLISAMPDAIAAAPKAKHAIIPDAGGYICEMQPDLVAGLLTDFFEEVGHD
jgi:haloalkane dehalogenase